MPGASDAERIRKADRPSRLMARKPRRRMSPPAPEARIDGAVAQLGERLLCKQDVVGSIPSGSTMVPLWGMRNHSQQKFAEGFGLSPVLHDIVKRRFVRVPRGIPVVRRRETLNLRHMIGCLTAPSDRSREAGLFCQAHRANREWRVANRVLFAVDHSPFAK